MSLSKRPKVFCALDGQDLQKLTTLARSIAAHVDGFKTGLEFFCTRGPEGIRAISEMGKPIFLDLKLHDIPNTVKGAVSALHPIAPSILTIHASGGEAMIRAALEGMRESWGQDHIDRSKIVGVTVLTSLDEADLDAQSIPGGSTEHALRLATLTQSAGAHGVVCAPQEAASLRARFGEDFCLVVPGVRPVWADANDQKRVMTPADAAKAGADVLVIGRPITGASSPADAAKRIAEELDSA